MTLNILLKNDGKRHYKKYMTHIPEHLKTFLQEKGRGENVFILVTGVFDVLHNEHLLFLQKAKALGTVLIVALESDARVRKIKGEGRPIHSGEQRADQIKALHLADFVFILPEEFSRREDHDALIREIRPHFLAISSHTAHQKEKRAILQKYGGDIRIVHQRNPDVSTTQILNTCFRTTPLIGEERK